MIKSIIVRLGIKMRMGNGVRIYCKEVNSKVSERGSVDQYDLAFGIKYIELVMLWRYGCDYGSEL